MRDEILWMSLDAYRDVVCSEEFAKAVKTQLIKRQKSNFKIEILALLGMAVAYSVVMTMSFNDLFGGNILRFAAANFMPVALFIIDIWMVLSEFPDDVFENDLIKNISSLEFKLARDADAIRKIADSMLVKAELVPALVNNSVDGNATVVLMQNLAKIQTI